MKVERHCEACYYGKCTDVNRNAWECNHPEYHKNSVTFLQFTEAGMGTTICSAYEEEDTNIQKRKFYYDFPDGTEGLGVDIEIYTNWETRQRLFVIIDFPAKVSWELRNHKDEVVESGDKVDQTWEIISLHEENTYAEKGTSGIKPFTEDTYAEAISDPERHAKNMEIINKYK